MNLEGQTPPPIDPLESDRVDRLVERTWMGIIRGHAPEPMAVGGVPAAPRRVAAAIVGHDVVDLIGIGLVLAFVLWTAAVARLEGGDPMPPMVVAVAGLLAFLLTRLLPRPHIWAPLIVVVASVLLSIFPLGGTVASGRRFGPMGYANASALFYLLATTAAGMLAVRVRTTGMRHRALAGAVGFAVAAIASGSRVGVALLALVPLAGLVRRPRHVQTVLRLGAILVLIAIATPLLLGALHGTRWGPEATEGAVSWMLTKKRLDVWADSLHIATSAPVRGVGPGRFHHVSPSALHAKDAVAVYNEYLQAAAELGLVGFALAVSLVFWAFAYLWRNPLDRGSALAGAGLTAAGIHASVDYVFHAPAVVLALVLLVAAGPRATEVARWSRHREPAGRTDFAGSALPHDERDHGSRDDPTIEPE